MNVAAVELADRSRYGMAMPTSDERLREAMLYVAQALETDHGGRGAVKLNKVLWWADFESFRERHRSVTGAMYQKLPEGPAPVRLRPARDALLADGDAELRERDVGAPRREAILHALRAPAAVFDDDDLRFLDMAAQRFRGMTGRECSDFSHQASVGWRAVEMEQVIPYETSIIDPRPLTEADRAWGVSIAARAGLIPSDRRSHRRLGRPHRGVRLGLPLGRRAPIAERAQWRRVAGPTAQCSAGAVSSCPRRRALPNGGASRGPQRGMAHTCGLRIDGVAECWGNTYTWMKPYNRHEPDPNSRFTSISSGGSHVCGVRTDGAIECWGLPGFIAY